MFTRGKQAKPKEGLNKITKEERKLAAEVTQKAELIRAEHFDVPDVGSTVVSAGADAGAPSSVPPRASKSLPATSRQANMARERMRQRQKKVKLSFADRLTDKVAAGQKSDTYLMTALAMLLSPVDASDCDAARVLCLQGCEALLQRY